MKRLFAMFALAALSLAACAGPGDYLSDGGYQQSRDYHADFDKNGW